MWNIIRELRQEQESYKDSIFATFKNLQFNLPTEEVDQSNFPQREENKRRVEENKHDYYRDTGYSETEYMRQEQEKIDKILPVSRPKHLDIITQEMMNNAAGSGSNQDDYMVQEKYSEGEGDEVDYNEEGTSGGNAKYISHDKDYRRPKFGQPDTLDNDGRVLQGNERRGRQKQSKKRRDYKNVRETGRDSGDEYEEEEKIPGPTSSSGYPQQHFKKREKGKQSQPYGRQSEGPSSGTFGNLTKQEQRPHPDTYMVNMGGTHASQVNQRPRQVDHRQGHSTGDTSYRTNKRKDQKLSAESGGTDFNQNQSVVNQNEERKASSQNYPYEANTQGNINQPSNVGSHRVNVPTLNIGQRASSPEGHQAYPNLMHDTRDNDNEVSTPRRNEQLENESKKTSGASTPSRDGADTPTRKNFNEHQQQLGDKKGFIHDLTASNFNRKYPIDRARGNPGNEHSRNPNNTYSQLPMGEHLDFAQQPLAAQNSYDEREQHRRGNFTTGRQDMDYEGDYQSYQDPRYQ